MLSVAELTVKEAAKGVLLEEGYFKQFSVNWLASLFDGDNMAFNRKDFGQCARSLNWLEEAGGLKTLEKELNTNRHDGLVTDA